MVTNEKRFNFYTLKQDYKKIKNEIISRLKEFKEIWKMGDDNEVFEELVFCLLTPQSKARICWETVLFLKQDNSLYTDDQERLSFKLNRVRFRNNKAKYIINARSLFMKNNRIIIKKLISEMKNPFEIREYFVKNVKGMDYKEASHFLRNIGLGEEFSILDRHILKNLLKYGVIDEIPYSLSRKVYINIEKKMKDFSKNIGIPVSHLDLLFWYKETGEVFK